MTITVLHISILEVSHTEAASETTNLVGRWSLNQLGLGLYKPRTQCMEDFAVYREDRSQSFTFMPAKMWYDRSYAKCHTK